MLRSGPPRILVVDDLVDAADSCATLLKVWGYAAQVCYDGAKVVEAACTFRPGAVLLDIGMRGRDGSQVALGLRDQPLLADTPIIGVTGYGDTARRHARLVGFDHYLLKPVDPDELRALLGDTAPMPLALGLPRRVGRLRAGIA